MANLWRHSDFMKLWTAQAVSSLGARISREGLPFAAIAALEARPLELGILSALSMGPGLVGLFVGGLVDRSRRKLIMVAMDLFRFAVLMTVPIAAWLHLLEMWQLYIVAALVGAGSVVFDLADRAFLPTLLDKDDLFDGNAKLSITQSTAEIGGPGLAGLLFKYLTPPIAIVVDAVTYLISAALLVGIRTSEEAAPKPPRDRHWADDLRFGWQAIMEQPLVRPLLFMTMLSTLFASFFGGLYGYFAIRTLEMGFDILGLAIAVGGVGALIGALAAPRITRTLGVGPTIIVCGLVSAASAFLIPFAPVGAWGVAFMMVSQLVGDSFGVAAMIPAVTLQQTVIAPRSLGRAGAIFQVARGGLAVIGAVTGGVLATVGGVRETMFVACVGMLVAQIGLLASPLRTFRDPPASGS